MQDTRCGRASRSPGRLSHLGFAAILLLAGLPLSGCLSPLSKQSTAVALATAPVLDQAAATYEAANRLHDLRQDYDAATQFDKTSPAYNPRSIQPLLSANDIHVRLLVLAAFQDYTRTLVEITSGHPVPQLDAASRSLGSSLTSFGNTVAPAFESTLGIATAPASTTQTTVTTTTGNTTTTTTSTSSQPAPPITPTMQNGISTAAYALGQFLTQRRVKRELPPILAAMDPHLQALSKLLEDDLDILQDQEQRDFNSILDGQTLFLRKHTGMDPLTRRKEIMKLPEIVRQQRAAGQQIVHLRDAIRKLAEAHHTLASEAQSMPPESLRQRLDDLVATADSLGDFYSSLSAKSEKD